MEKIPTVFERDDATRKATNKVSTGCQWVLDGEGVATEKFDGTNVRLTIRSGTIVRIEKRRNPSKIQKKDGIREPWYVDVNEYAPEDRWIREAADNTEVSWPDGEHSCEAIGPKIQGNPLGLDQHVCVPFDLQEVPRYDVPDRTFTGLRALLANIDSKYSPDHPAEGVVFHHPDGRRSKIKRKDFGSSESGGL